MKFAREFEEVQFVWKWNCIHRNSALFSGEEEEEEDFFHLGEEEEEEEGFQEAVPSGLSLLRPNEALTPDPVTLQSVRLAAPSQDRAGFDRIWKYLQIFNCLYTHRRDENKSTLIPCMRSVFAGIFQICSLIWASAFLFTEKLSRHALRQKEGIGIFWSFCLLGLKFQREDSHAVYLETSGT